MRIVVINTAASTGGAISILREFYDYVKKNDSVNEWIFIVSDNYIDDYRNIKVELNSSSKSSWFGRLKWELFYGAKFINQLEPDVVFSLQNMMCRGITSPTAIYLHQVIPFQNQKKFSFFKPKERKLFIYQNLIGSIIKSSIKHSNLIFVQSDWLRNIIIKKGLVDEDKIIVARPSVDVPIFTDVEINNNHFFYPANSEIYKNHNVIISAASRLVEEGISDFRIDFTVKSGSIELPPILNENVFFLGQINRDDVLDKYSKTVLLFPSYMESFGLPLLECRESGGYIISSNTPFAREVLDGYPNKIYFNPFNSTDLYHVLKNLIGNNVQLQHMMSRAKKEDCWEKIYNNILNLSEVKDETKSKRSHADLQHE